MGTEPSADMVLRKAAGYTMDPAGRWVGAVAIRGGTIVAAGTDEDVQPWIGTSTDVVDLQGRMLIPGFQDAHVHPLSGGLKQNQCNLEFLSDAPAYLAAISEYARRETDAAWILGGGWSMSAFPRGLPDLEALDAAVPRRPVFIPNRDAHSAWVNSVALEIAGVTRTTMDPADGRIERNPDGSCSGVLHEGAMELVKRVIPETTPEEWHEGLKTGQRYLHSLGITAWQDAAVGSPGRHTLDTYCSASRSGSLTARVVGALWWDRDAGMEQVDGLLERRERAGTGRFRATSVKMMLDGVCETFTANMLSPYLDAGGTETTNLGMEFIDPESLQNYVAELDRLGFQVHFHSLGDAAVRHALDAVEAALVTNGPSDNRHHLAHIQVIDPSDLSRFRALGAVANAQPLWACNDAQMLELTLPFIGPERSQWQYPFDTLHRLGVQLAMGSDWSVSSPNPLAEIHVAVNRALPDTAMDVFLPEERLDLPTALRAFTMGSAYVNHLDDITGSIEVGKRADLAVIDRNLFELPPTEISQARVILTLVDGKPVFDAANL